MQGTGEDEKGESSEEGQGEEEGQEGEEEEGEEEEEEAVPGFCNILSDESQSDFYVRIVDFAVLFVLPMGALLVIYSIIVHELWFKVRSQFKVRVTVQGQGPRSRSGSQFEVTGPVQGQGHSSSSGSQFKVKVTVKLNVEVLFKVRVLVQTQRCSKTPGLLFAFVGTVSRLAARRR